MKRRLNAPEGQGNTEVVIRASLFGAALLASAILAGCAGPARSPGPPGSTAILLENRVDGDCDLTWANGRLDDRPFDLVTIAPPGARPATLARPILAPGEHTVSISASASCKSRSGEPPAVLQVTQQVYMGKDGGQIVIALSPDKDASTALKASFEVEGGHVLAPRADGQELDCRGRLPMDWAICRTEASLARAQQKHDVVLALCITDKLREMRVVKGTLEPGALGVPSRSSAPRDVSQMLPTDVAEDAAHRVIALAREADFCIGQETMAESGTFIEPAPKPRTTAPAFR